MKTDLLIIFVKNPVLGKAKTRLATTIGNEKALKIYELLLAKTQQETIHLNVDKVVYYSDYIDRDDLWPNDHYQKAVQSNGDLGDRITTAFKQAFEDGYRHVCIIGSDCYEMSESDLASAFSILKSNDAIIGPAEDGGYYTIGMSKFIPQLFEGKIWSTETVASDTINDFQNLSLHYEVLPTLNDVDTEKDLGPWADSVLG